MKMEISFDPYKKVTFQSHLRYTSAKAFIDVISLVNPPEMGFQAKLFWANGVLFRPFSHSPSEVLAKEIINGHLIFDHIEFAPMPIYKKESNYSRKTLGPNYIIDVKVMWFLTYDIWIHNN
jgi:hypothetical protein